MVVFSGFYGVIGIKSVLVTGDVRNHPSSAWTRNVLSKERMFYREQYFENHSFFPYS